MKEYKVLFCDMDGTLIETVSGETFPKGIWDMKFKFDVLDAIKNLNLKWNESEIKASEVLSVIPFKPLFGHTTGRQSKTIWMCFMKREDDE